MNGEPPVSLMLNTQVYPLTVLQSAAMALSGKIEVVLREEEQGQVPVELWRLDESIPEEEVRWRFNRELIGSLGLYLAFVDGHSMRQIFMDSAFAVVARREE